MGNLIDLTNQKFERWTVLKQVKNPHDSSAAWLCLCDCGNISIVRGKDLRYGKSKSCGCLRTKHGGEGSPLYRVWHGIKVRCFNPNSPAFKDYGGRGITVCSEWLNDFAAFRDWAIENGYRAGLSIDRIDNDGPYSPDNCRWATTEEQANNRRSNHLVSHNGETHTLSEWSRLTGIPRTILRNRLNILNWSVEKSLTTPVNVHKSRDS